MVVPVDEESNYDEHFMQKSLLFSESLEKLKSLRTQLYSAAEYFEASYTSNEPKGLVMERLKDYTTKALINTADHLETVTHNVNDILDEKINDVHRMEIRVSCIEQRTKTYQAKIDREGLSQQSLVVTTPKYRKHYIFPGDYSFPYSGLALSWTLRSPRSVLFQNIQRASPINLLRGRSLSPSRRLSQRLGTFSFSGIMLYRIKFVPRLGESLEKLEKKVSERQTVSPQRSKFPLRHSGSLSNRTTTPTPSRLITPNSRNAIRRYPSEPRRSTSLHFHDETKTNNLKEIDRYPSKSKRLLKTLLSRRKSKKDSTLNTFLDEF
ncbi:hypothetical protein GIB67_033407 [Kingdonia uniflora]|uniref:Uncharacterized protein n=1 Tax=Kingdonia uniflora TaxID=39325 RepID=A0A7J7LU21_9MAGN|nr:hypothetical protein GIB67_033407 [Kingdonia uniflora]